MLKLKPNCEYCDKDLSPEALDAMICTYECTFCSDCVEAVLCNVCPNCGGGFVSRPIRPKTARRSNTSLLHQPPSTERVNTKFSREEITTFSDQVKMIPPEER